MTKIVLTGTGEAISDAISQQLRPAIAVPIMLVVRDHDYASSG